MLMIYILDIGYCFFFNKMAIFIVAIMIIFKFWPFLPLLIWQLLNFIDTDIPPRIYTDTNTWRKVLTETDTDTVNFYQYQYRYW